jgi:molecular chaperone HscB
MIQCPSCGQRQEPRLICTQCGAPLGAELDCFAVFGLPKRLVIDAAALERTYHDLSRRIHPDRFARHAARSRDASLRSTALLTRSYRTLRDPIARGLYWLEMRGQKLGEDNQQVPSDLAELVFEVQEQLEDARAAKSRGNAAAAAQTVGARRQELQRAMDALNAELAATFERWDRAGESDASALTAELKGVLSKIAYLRTLIRDVDREIENLKAA